MEGAVYGKVGGHECDSMRWRSGFEVRCGGMVMLPAHNGFLEEWCYSGRVKSAGG